MDDTYLGGERTEDKRGRGAADKMPLVAAAETTSDRNPVKLKLWVEKGFRSSEIKPWSQQH
ncbi:MAG: hypothetical protein JKX81_11135 [Arenicella sp.]|nr:hypothetical protein [Arenicella sp.]